MGGWMDRWTDGWRVGGGREEEGKDGGKEGGRESSVPAPCIYSLTHTHTTDQCVVEIGWQLVQHHASWIIGRTPGKFSQKHSTQPVYGSHYLM